MKELEKPTGNLKTFIPRGVMGNTINDLVRFHMNAISGNLKLDYGDIEQLMLAHGVTLTNCTAMLRRYQLKMKPEHPAYKEFEDMIGCMIEAVAFRTAFEHDFRVSRQRNSDYLRNEYSTKKEVEELRLQVKKLQKEKEELIKNF